MTKEQETELFEYIRKNLKLELTNTKYISNIIRMTVFLKDPNGISQIIDEDCVELE